MDATLDATPSLFVLGSFVVACSAHVDRFPAPGESAHATRFIVEPGGKGFNLATGIHRLGANVGSIFAIGEDAFGRVAEAAFEQAGFTPTSLLKRDGGTGSGIGFTDALGETSLAIYPGTNFTLSAADVEEVADHIRGAKVLLAPFEIADAPIEAAFALAARHGVATLLNPSPFRMPTEAMLLTTTGLVVNEIEANALAHALGHGAFAAAMDDVLERGPQFVIVTRGASGAVLYRQDGLQLIQPAFRVESIDSLGAGDAFLAAFAVGWAKGETLPRCLREAAAAGAMAASQPGVFQALPSCEALKAFEAERHDEALPQTRHAI